LAERMLGDTMTEFLSHRSTLEVAHTRSVEARALPPALELPAIDRPARALRAKTAGVAAKADMFRCGGVCQRWLDCVKDWNNLNTRSHRPTILMRLN